MKKMVTRKTIGAANNAYSPSDVKWTYLKRLYDVLEIQV